MGLVVTVLGQVEKMKSATCYMQSHHTLEFFLSISSAVTCQKEIPENSFLNFWFGSNNKDSESLFFFCGG